MNSCCIGNYHPVDVGDTLRDGQYKVLRKLGYGPRSTICLVRDNKSNTYVAVKTVTADGSTGDELRQVTLHKHLEAYRVGGVK